MTAGKIINMIWRKRYCYRTCDVFTPQQKVGISSFLGWVGSTHGLTISCKTAQCWYYPKCNNQPRVEYDWVGCTYSTCLQVLQVGLLSSDWLQLGWLHLFYMPTGPTGEPTLIRLVTIGLAALILHAYRSHR